MSVRRNVTVPRGRLAMSRARALISVCWRSLRSCPSKKPIGTMPYFFAARSKRWRARSRVASSANAVWSKRASAFRTCDLSWIGRRRRPCASTYANALSGRRARALAASSGNGSSPAYPPRRVKGRVPADVAIIAGLTAIYFAAGKLGLSLAFVHASASAVWPPTGIALAALLFFGPRVWPGVLIAAFLVNLTTAGSVVSSAGIAIGNTLEAVLAAYLVERYANGIHAFERLGDVLRFSILAALVSPLVSATFGVTSLCLTGFAQWADFGPVWLTWWLGDAGGALIVAPLLIVWGNDPRPHGWDRRYALELGAFAAAFALTVLIMFGGVSPFAGTAYPTTFLAFPALVWAAFRFGP